MAFCKFPKRALIAALSMGLLASCVHKKYDSPITKNTQQPDKVLFDQAIKDIEHGRYAIARISLQTLMNTYESSEYMAKAKLAVADSWYREGGANGLAQAEAEYKDFILFYPNMPEAAQAQNRVCQIHYKQMDKSDRDDTQTLRAQYECRQLLVQFPNSKFAPAAQQMLRNIQESLAEHEFVVGDFYFKREMNPAAANRLNALVDQFPLYSKADEALYEAGESYQKMGPRYRKQAAEMYGRLVSDYPLSARAADAKKKLQDMELPVPATDRNALALEKYNIENAHTMGLFARTTAFLHSGPDVSHAATAGNPTMTDPKPTIPVSVPPPTNTETAENNSGASGSGTTDVTASQVGNSNALETNPDARTAHGSTQAASGSQQNAQPLPTNRDAELKRYREKQEKQREKLAKKKKKKHGQEAKENVSTSTDKQTEKNAQTPEGTPAPASQGAAGGVNGTAGAAPQQ